MDERQNIVVSERSQTPKEHILCDYIYTKFKDRQAKLVHSDCL